MGHSRECIDVRAYRVHIVPDPPGEPAHAGVEPTRSGEGQAAPGRPSDQWPASSSVEPSLELSEIPIEPQSRRTRNRLREAHHVLSVRVNEGEVVAVAGSPGFGGTTLARFAAGVARPESGRIIVNGIQRLDATSPAADRDAGLMPVGFVPIDGGLLPHLTLQANITYGARLAGWTNPVILDRLDILSEKLELQPSLGLRPHEVSAGQRIRAALARVAMRHVQAPILAVDGTSGARGLADLTRMIERVWWPSRASVLLCTGNADMIRQSERVYLVGCGPDVLSGPTAQMRTSPPNLASAMVLLSSPIAVLTGTARGGQAHCDGVLFPVAAEVSDGQRIVVVLTADSVELVPMADGLAARVVSTDSLRMASLVEPAARPGHRWPPSGRWPARLVAPGQVKQGVRVGVRIERTGSWSSMRRGATIRCCRPFEKWNRERSRRHPAILAQGRRANPAPGGCLGHRGRAAGGRRLCPR